jgi:hypothetical protein
VVAFEKTRCTAKNLPLEILYVQLDSINARKVKGVELGDWEREPLSPSSLMVG